MKYKVILTRDATESVLVEVEADNVTHAESVALREAGRYGEDVDGWDLDEGNFNEAYTTGVDKVEEEE